MAITLQGSEVMDDLVSGYIPISVSTLVPSSVVGIELFQEERDEHRYVLYRGSDYPLEQIDLVKLRSRGVNKLYIRKAEQSSYQTYLRKMIDDPGDNVPVSARAGALNEVVRDLLESAFKSGDPDASVDTATYLGEQTANIVCNDQFASVDLFRVLHHDYATFTHSANVAFYAGMLAAEIGFSQEEVALISSGGLIHDLGKLQIPDKILCKPGRLTELEFREIKKHPVTGFRQLAHREDLTVGQLMMVYQHHERVDGGGYPVGLCGDEIHPWAKVCAVVDVFEALTSNRPYRTPMPKRRAIELLEHERDGYEQEFLECWKKITNRLWRS
ncbi:Cyclic di-GMP phosphodiesterase response regulator RpfG [Rosistilla ulvae]|uniref:Cyclic di-GMP phosphodiesterase response regulator RpfG n=1 Tax=Rosistilla ulvae TaxID=1930277 RepID=A0A517LYI3_9BACT|nr:HD domain-containing phosphohydrolase [Rosistilla ulvae]QDS87673.1 Cyclic di-GMP phosphodiesterase response regulator RpfG [Rosistilla ulvae]